MNPTYVAIFGIVWSTIVAAIGWHMGFRSGLKAQRQLKLEHFVSYIESLIQQIESKNTATWWEFYRSTFQEFSRQVDDVRSHIRDRRRREFVAACASYPGFTCVILPERPEAEKERQKCLSLLREILSYTK